MLNVVQKNISVIEVENNFVFEIHEVATEDGPLVEVWVYQKEYDTKIHAFGIMKEAIENPMKLYQHIEEHMEEYINQYKEEVMDEE